MEDLRTSFIHMELSSEESQTKCETCDVVCSGPIPYKAHMKSPKHSKTALKKFLENKFEGKYKDRFTCKKCSKAHPDIFSFQMHMENNECERVLQKSHAKEILELGNLCRVAIIQNSNDASGSNFAVGLKLFICTLCSKILRSNVEAEKHQKECQHTTLQKTTQANIIQSTSP